METIFMLTRVVAFVKVYIQVMNNGHEIQYLIVHFVLVCS